MRSTPAPEKKGMGVAAIVKADVKAHRWAFQHRKEIAGVMGTINNALASKKTSIGAIGVIVAAIGAACQHFGDGTVDTVGLVMEVLGVLKLAYGLFNARDNDVTSAQAGAYPGQRNQGHAHRKVVALLAVLAVLALPACVGLRRGLTDVGKRMLVPTTEQGVLTDLKLVEDDIAVQTANKDRLTVARDAIANAAVEYDFDADKALAAADALVVEVDKNLAYLVERKRLLDAAKAVYDEQRAAAAATQ